MLGVPRVRPSNEASIKSLLSNTAFVAGNQQNRAALWIKGKCNAPLRMSTP
jgi:hypothetical protein